MSRTRAATIGLALPALMALGWSADTSYRFMGTRLGITNPLERGSLCGVAEAAILALSVYSWATRTKGAAYLAYCIVLVQAVPAFEVSAVAGGIARVALGPVLLAVMLHLLLGLEVRMSGDRTDGIIGAALRELRERVTAYLGIGRRGEDSAAIARSRAADRAVTLADKLAAVDPGCWRHRRRAAALAAAIDDARHGLDREAADAAEASIVGRIVRRKSVADLATIDARHDWSSSLFRPEVPARVPQVPEQAEPVAELPAPPVPAVVPVQVPPQVPAELTPEGRTEAIHGIVERLMQEQEAEALGVAPGAGTSAEVPRNTEPEPPQVTRPALELVRNAGGTRAEHIRALIADGVTETGTIRNILTASGVKVPSDRYIRRLVSEAQNTQVPPGVPATGTGAYM